MPTEAVSLALAASIYPPALAVVIALGRGTQVRLRVLLLVVAAFFTVLVTGSLMLLLFTEVGGSSSPTRTVGTGLYIAAGVALVGLAAHLQKRDPDASKKDAGTSKTDRYLESARLVLLLGVVLYVVPSPIFVGVVKAIADTHASTAQQLVYLVTALVIMLWMIEIPMLLLLMFPARGSRVLESVNGWFARNGRLVAVLVSAGAGLYLIAVGLLEVL
jgi:Sap, sulfolipid-1-addressing protein